MQVDAAGHARLQRHQPPRAVVQQRGARGVPARRRRGRHRPGAPRPSRGRGRATPVSARPRPGTGRKTSCWCSWAVPPPTAPPIRLALRASSSRGPEDPPGEDPAAEAGRQALDPVLHPVGEPLAVVAVPDAADAAVARVVRGLLRARGCRPTSTRCRRASGSGRWWSSGRPAGTARPGPRRPPPARAPRSSGRSSRRRARCPGRTPAAASQGTGPSSAQSTLTVPGSIRKPRIPRATRAGRSAGSSRRPKRWGAATSATTARRAATRSPSASLDADGAAAVDVRTRVTSASQRISPPSAVNRRASAALSSPAPPSGTGKPTVWPEHRHQQPHQPGARRVERDVAVPGVARPAGCGAPRRRSGPSPARRRRQQGPDEAEPADAAEPGQPASSAGGPAGTASAGRRRGGPRSGPTRRRGRARPARPRGAPRPSGRR